MLTQGNRNGNVGSGPHVRFCRVQTLVREGSPLVKAPAILLSHSPAVQAIKVGLGA